MSQQTVPRMARDSFRGWVSLVLMVPLSLVIGAAVVGVALWTDVRVELRSLQVFIILLTYAFYFVFYELVTWRTFRRFDAPQLQRVLSATKPRRRLARLSWVLSGGGAATWSVTAATIALGVALVVAFTPSLRSEPLVLVGAAVLVISAWFLIPVTYAVQYLREDADVPGLEFPGEEEPVFADYFYLAVQISTTFATSDVTVLRRRMRNLVTVHSLVAFLFSTVIIALVVSAILISAPT